MKRLFIAALLFAAVHLCGCLSGRVEMGVDAPVERIERELRAGESTEADVLRVLGNPDGKGEAWLPIHAGPRTVWSYYYEFADFAGTGIERSGRTFVWVYLDGETYDGYLWFSSVPDQITSSRPR